MAVDILLPYGGDMQWSSLGAPVLVKDTPNDPAATQQQLEALVMLTPRLLDVDGVAIGRPGNMSYPDRGGGLPVMVGLNPLPKYINAMIARIQRGLATNGNVAASPAPTVTTSSVGPALGVFISCQRTNGQVVQLSVTQNS